MKFEDAVKKIEGAQVAGGQLIVNRDGTNILVGKHVQGMLIVEDTDAAKAVMLEIGVVVGGTIDEEAAPKTHEVRVDDKVETKDSVNKK